MADMHRYQVQCICSTAWFIANAVVVVFKSQRYVQEQPQLTKHLPDYFVLSSLNRSRGTLFCSRFRTEGRCSEKHLCKKYNDFRPTSCKIHAELDMPSLTSIGSSLKLLSPSLHRHLMYLLYSTLAYFCIFLSSNIFNSWKVELHLDSLCASGAPDACLLTTRACCLLPFHS